MGKALEGGVVSKEIQEQELVEDLREDEFQEGEFDPLAPDKSEDSPMCMGSEKPDQDPEERENYIYSKLHISSENEVRAMLRQYPPYRTYLLTREQAFLMTPGIFTNVLYVTYADSKRHDHHDVLDLTGKSGNCSARGALKTIYKPLRTWSDAFFRLVAKECPKPKGLPGSIEEVDSEIICDQVIRNILCAWAQDQIEDVETPYTLQTIECQLTSAARKKHSRRQTRGPLFRPHSIAACRGETKRTGFENGLTLFDNLNGRLPETLDPTTLPAGWLQARASWERHIGHLMVEQLNDFHQDDEGLPIPETFTAHSVQAPASDGTRVCVRIPRTEGKPLANLVSLYAIASIRDWLGRGAIVIYDGVDLFHLLDPLVRNGSDYFVGDQLRGRDRMCIYEDEGHLKEDLSCVAGTYKKPIDRIAIVKGDNAE